MLFFPKKAGGFFVASVVSGITDPQLTVHTVTLPTGMAVGDLIVGFFRADDNDVQVWSGGFTPVFSALDTGPFPNRTECQSRVVDGTEGATITVTTTPERAAWIFYHIPGAGSTPEAATVNGTGVDMDPPNLTPSWGAKENIWLAGYACDYGDTIPVSASPANYTDLLEVGTRLAHNGGADLGIARRVLNAASENPGVFTQSASRGWLAWTVAIEPA